LRSTYLPNIKSLEIKGWKCDTVSDSFMGVAHIGILASGFLIFLDDLHKGVV
jgi:hypothetical protein